MWGAHCDVLWPQPSSISQGGKGASCAPPNALVIWMCSGKVSDRVE